MNWRKIIRSFLPRGHKPHVIRRGPLKGRRIVTSWHDYPAAILGRTERPLLTWFQKNVHPSETWLDVGAHYGYTALALSHLVGDSGRVFAFEPMYSTAGYLSQTRLLNGLSQLTVLPLAVAMPTDLEVKMLPTVRGMIDSSLQPGQWSETILIACLDWLWPRVCGERKQINGIKIDVQGMEIEALHGMANLLKTHRPKLVIEVHQGVDRAELLNLIKELGYSIDAIPIEPLKGEIQPQFVDDKSYAFQAA
jgi:FkbM family methyltransferase